MDGEGEDEDDEAWPGVTEMRKEADGLGKGKREAVEEEGLVGGGGEEEEVGGADWEGGGGRRWRGDVVGEEAETCPGSMRAKGR